MPEDEKREEGLPEMPDTSLVDAKIKDIQSRAGAIKQRQKDADLAQEKTRQTAQKDAQSLGAGLQIFYALVGFPLLGFGVGALLDHLLGLNLLKGIVGFVGCVLAVVSAVILIKKSNTQT